MDANTGLPPLSAFAVGVPLASLISSGHVSVVFRDRNGFTYPTSSARMGEARASNAAKRIGYFIVNLCTKR